MAKEIGVFEKGWVARLEGWVAKEIGVLVYECVAIS